MIDGKVRLHQGLHRPLLTFSNGVGMTDHMRFVFPFAVPKTVPVAGSDLGFPVGRIFCVGRNYAAHAREMGSNPDREPPFFFTKPANSLLAGQSCTLPYPPRTQDLHHEVELVIGLQSGGCNIPIDAALEHVYGVAVGLDFTRRDLQGEAKSGGRPWDMAKGFDGSAVIGVMQPASGAAVPQVGDISLSVNGDERQRGDLGDMIWSIPEVIAELSSYMALAAGDLIFTGTPDGVSAVLPGDVVEAQCVGLDVLKVEITGA